MKLFSTKLWRRLFVGFATFLVVIIAGTGIAYDQSAALNSAFKCKTYEIKKAENAGTVNTEYFASDFDNQADLTKYCEDTCELIEASGLVLLKNEGNALPLNKGAKVSAFLQGSVNFNYSTSGSSNTGSTEGYPTLSDSLSGAGLSVNTTLRDFYMSDNITKTYKRGAPNNVYMTREAPWNLIDSTVQNSFNTYGDAAVIVLSRNSGEGKDITTVGSDGLDGSYLTISAEEKDVMTHVSSLRKSGVFKSVVLILNTPCMIQMDFLDDNDFAIDSILWTGNVGYKGINAIGKVMTGDVVPSGRLADTILKDNYASPAMATWAANPGKSFTQVYTNASSYSEFDNAVYNTYAVYNEGIYVGYRYFETRYEDVIMGTSNVGSFDYSKKVAYTFGYGLSYAEFSYSGFGVEEKEDEFEVTVSVKNDSTKYTGREVVQIYLQKPYTDYDIANGIEKAAVELCGFAKTAPLAPGASETVKVTVKKEQLKSYDANNKKTYIVEDGDYYFAVGKNAHDAVNNILTKKGYSPDDFADDKLAVKWKNATFDDTTYSHSTANKETEITNQFDFADMNRYEGKGSNKVTYVSRNNWNGTFPTSATKLAMTDKMAEDLKSNKEIKDNGEKMPEYGVNNGLNLIMLRSTPEKPIPYDDEVWDRLLDQMTAAEQAYLITNGQHNTILVESVNKPATRDENGPNGVSGSVTKVTYPSEAVWASSFDMELLERVGDAYAEDARASGIVGLYAPGANLHRTPFGGRNHEYFSEDPFLMGMCTAKEVQGIQKKGVIAYVKHFVANNEETNRNGVAIWLNEQEMRELILYPFELAFRPDYGNAHALMTSFNRIGCIWTSASPELMENVLRDEWAFDGFAITDMAASNAKIFMTFVDGVANGTNLFDGPGSTDALDQWKDIPAFANKMRESAHRILYCICNFSAIMNGLSSDDILVPVMTWWQITLVSLIAFAGVLTAGSAAMFAVSLFKKSDSNH